jgi:Uma2 family endonuclease
MGLPLRTQSLVEFLDWENAHPERHEYWRGEVFAMVGGRRSHGRVVANLVRQLGNQLAGRRCQAFAESMKLQIADDTILYPDVFVTCDAADLSTDMIFRSPTLVIEVLSPTTQAYDRSQKFALYRRVPTLAEYVLIDPETRRVELFRKGADGLWDLHDFSDDIMVVMASVDCTVAMADLFDGVNPEP